MRSTPLRARLPSACATHVVGLGGEADEHRPARARATAAGRARRGCRACASSVSVSAPSLLGDLLSATVCRRVVGHGGRHDHHIRPPVARAITAACISAALRTRTTLDAGRRLEVRRAGHEDHGGAAARRFGGQGEAHAAARPVADEAHRIDVFEGRAGRHQHRAARPASRRPPSSRLGRGDDVVGLGEPALADPAAGQIPVAGIDEPHAARRQRLEVRLHRRDARACACSSPAPAAPAPSSPGTATTGSRRRGRWRTCRSCWPWPARPAAGRWSDARAMCSMSAFAPGVHWLGDHRAAGDRLEGQRADEPPGAAGHHGDDVVPVLLQPARDLDRLVGADAAGDAECDECHVPVLAVRAEERADDRFGDAAHPVHARPLGGDDLLQPHHGRLELVVDHDVVVLAGSARLRPGRSSSRRCIASSLSLLRPRSRRSSTSNDGGSTKIAVWSAPRCRTCRAPCTSITSTTSWPSPSRRSVSAARGAVEVAEDVGPLEELAARRSSPRTRSRLTKL